MGPKFNVSFDFKEIFKDIKGKQVRIAIMLIDNAGYSCGIYNNYRDAKIAIHKIRRNIVADLKKRLKNGRSIPREFIDA